VRGVEPVELGDAVRARVPAVLSSQAENVAGALGDRLVDRRLKELCARYLMEDDDVVGGADDPSTFDSRERAALRWTHAIAWDSEAADDELWQALHAHFSEPQLVELGYAIAFMMGQQRWLATMGLPPGRLGA
jgi:hypothetical protein